MKNLIKLPLKRSAPYSKTEELKLIDYVCDGLRNLVQREIDLGLKFIFNNITRDIEPARSKVVMLNGRLNIPHKTESMIVETIIRTSADIPLRRLPDIVNAVQEKLAHQLQLEAIP